MRKIREVLRLRLELGLSERDTAASCRIARSTVGDYVHRARKAGLSWPLPPDLDDATLEQLLFKVVDRAPPTHVWPQPNWPELAKQLSRKGVTRLLLWREYRQQHPDGMKYTTFTRHFREWAATHRVTMRLTHHAGEKLYVDYAGLTLPLTDPKTGERHDGQVFVATLGASGYTYVEVTLTQSTQDWLGAHVRALAFFGGVPRVIVPDNLKTGVKHPGFYEPEMNRAYAEFAQHYGVAVIPARVRKPKDKAKVEVHVQIVEREILAVLRDRVFFTLTEANAAVRELLDAVNARPYQKYPESRAELFAELDQPELRPLPAEPFEIATWRKARVGVDYHVEIDGHYYSVPHQHAKAAVDIRVTPRTVEVFKDGQRVAAHARPITLGAARGRHTSTRDHMPEAHRKHAEWNTARLVQWAAQVGEHTGAFIEALIASREHPEQGYRAALGVLRLTKEYGEVRVDAACRRALKLGRSVSAACSPSCGTNSMPCPSRRTWKRSGRPCMRMCGARRTTAAWTGTSNATRA